MSAAGEVSAKRKGERAGMGNDGAQEHQQGLSGVEIGVEKIAHHDFLFVCRCPSDIGTGRNGSRRLAGKSKCVTKAARLKWRGKPSWWRFALRERDTA
jgi:hypothetical protein